MEEAVDEGEQRNEGDATAERGQINRRGQENEVHEEQPVGNGEAGETKCAPPQNGMRVGGVPPHEKDRAEQTGQTTKEVDERCHAIGV